MATVRDIPLADIGTNGNVRFDVGDITTLADSIDRIGLIQPITVRANPDGGPKYLVVSGHRRFAAHQHLGWKEIPALVTQSVTDDGSRIEMQVAENVFREDLTPVEKAQAMLDLKNAGYNQKAVAAATGYSAKDVSAYQKLGRALEGYDTDAVTHAVAEYEEPQLLQAARNIEEEAIAPVLSMFTEKDEYGERAYWSLDDAYRQWQRNREIEERNAAVAADLEKYRELGVTIIEGNPYDTPGVKLRNINEQAEWASYYLQVLDPLILDTVAHRDEDCYLLVWSSGYDGKQMLTEKCTDPERHLKKDATVRAINKVSKQEAAALTTTSGEKAARTRKFNAAYRAGAKEWADAFKVTADEARLLGVEIIRNEMPYGWEKRTAKLLGYTGDNAGSWLADHYVTGTSPAKQLEGWTLLYMAQAIESQYHSDRSIPEVTRIVKELKAMAVTEVDAE